MAQIDNILQELKELQSSLHDLSRQNIYQVRAGYFEGLAGEVMRRIKALEAENGDDELKYLSPLIKSISKNISYRVPTGYFEKLAEQVFRRVKALETNDAAEELNHLSPLLNSISREMPYSVPGKYFDTLAETAAGFMIRDDQSPEEELAALSPLLNGLKKEMPYSVPGGYFDGLNETMTSGSIKPEVKVVSITGRKWFRYAAAAMVTGIIALAGFLIFGKKNAIDPNEQSYAWVKKNLKKVSDNDIDSFVRMVDATAPVVASVDVKDQIKEANEVKELIKDIPDEEIQKFLDDAEPASVEENSDDIFMN